MLKKTDKIWMNGKFVPWDEANVHILTHTLHYGLGAFEVSLLQYAKGSGDLQAR
jgi:branched-chain amino acid aminotransferase